MSLFKLPQLIFGKIFTKVQVVQWSSTLAAMAMLSARAWVQVPPTTSGVFLL